MQEIYLDWQNGLVRITKPGDINGDGLVTIGDVTKLERVILGLEPLYFSADINHDGETNIGDVTRIERIILGLDPA